MIISTNSEPNRRDFDDLIKRTINQLNTSAKQSTKKSSNLTGTKIELYIRDVISYLAVGTPFESSIELIGGQKFPDIVAKKS